MNRARPATALTPPGGARPAADDRRARLAIISGHTLLRECLAAQLSSVGRFAVVAQVADPTRALDVVCQTMPDVLVIDFSRPTGAGRDLVMTICRICPRVRVVLLGVSEIRDDVLRCIEVGVRGFVSNESSMEELVAVVDRILDGTVSASPSLAYALFYRLRALARERRRSQRIDALTLTRREMEILELIAKGHSNKRIARQLSLSVYTIKNHVHRILEKLQVEHRLAAVDYAYRRHWLRRHRH
ncbi:MAG: response regulator transcription factor [Acidobacteriota bacterium]